MKGDSNWRDVEEKQEAKFDRPPAGGYVVKILNAVDTDNQYDPAKPYLTITFDIETAADGSVKYQEFFAKRYEDTDGKIPYPNFRRYYMDRARGFFKHFLNMVERSNPSKFRAAAFNNEERKLKGMYIGVTLGYREYKTVDNNGNEVIREAVQVVDVLEVDQILAGEFQIPELKKLNTAAAPAQPSRDNFANAFGSEQLPF